MSRPGTVNTRKRSRFGCAVSKSGGSAWIAATKAGLMRALRPKPIPPTSPFGLGGVHPIQQLVLMTGRIAPIIVLLNRRRQHRKGGLCHGLGVVSGGDFTGSV